MKLLVFNCSPNMDRGNTALILQPFLEGATEAGAEVEILYSRKLDVKPCLGEYACWLKSPGVCLQHDDMREVLPKLKEADAIVFAVPVYCDGVTGPMKNLMDRMIPIAEPFIEMRRGHCRHPARDGGKPKTFALISSCGFWETDNFKPMIVHMKAFCKNTNWRYVGALVRPHAGALKPMMEMGMKIDPIFAAARSAGGAFIKTGRIPRKYQRQVRRKLLPRFLYIQKANEHFRQVLEKRDTNAASDS
ncbi:MAG: flavodoxin family protein [Candidatus Omnitrophota bacterium]|nr:MAG: flavodoxin family protein [Candidatus Omnitrophota bacterium]